MGILIRGGEPLERAYGLTDIVFDKTGTLTQGKPEVTEVVAFNPWTESQVLTLVAALEKLSEHPLAAAIVKKAAALQPVWPEVNEFEARPGLGVKALVDGKESW